MFRERLEWRLRLELKGIVSLVDLSAGRVVRAALANLVHRTVAHPGGPDLEPFLGHLEHFNLERLSGIRIVKSLLEPGGQAVGSFLGLKLEAEQERFGLVTLRIGEALHQEFGKEPVEKFVRRNAGQLGILAKSRGVAGGECEVLGVHVLGFGIS
jgi:hypothetical protein